ncbi:hypothetical protein PVL30_003398 [Lodderomyces elongisporus]|uniref:Uncharacterized protein n=1 Tax=Lodderomyces elongisporus (strain ATCC 11503 / CBS 2605 / JCM 1781 / NBRC 1676 / NRRL YB-4239) TaxID=379508 RepID=A5DYX8_LODEL|nr:uncharacterized protein PVL30_003398 [Lodderomyces elongisporus]EDK44386.1 hypothetical protein LELG_02565 [Lodderomyces elongisporus NRRL YB-4239]WLF79642.1 hypothetical protein PVL30_003398 [Lodderomyces elongisporus]
MICNAIISFFFLAVATLVNAAPNDPTILTPERGVFCSPVQASPKHPNKAYIKLHPEKTSADFKIQGLVFHYPDIINFTSVPILEEFTQLYAKEKTTLYKTMLNDDGTFNVDAADGYSTDPKKYWTGPIEKDVEITIVHSGIYCVYIAPPADDTDKFDIPIVFKSYYGNLNYATHLMYSQIKWAVLLSIITFATLFNYILKFKVGENFKDLNSISVISKAVIFLVLLPFIAILIFQWLVFFLINNFLESCQSSFIITGLLFIAQFASLGYNSFISYVVLLFSMGFGVIYYHGGNSHNYRIFPQDSFKKITALLFVNLVVIFAAVVGEFQSKNSDPLVGTYGQNSFNQQGMIVTLLMALTSIFSLSWFILSMIFYFKTKKTIATFPPAADADSTDKVVSAFRKSFFIIYVLPIAVGIFGACVAGALTAKSMKSLPKYPSNTDRELVYQSALAMQALEHGIKKIILPMLWSSWLYFFTLIISIFFIWIVDNNGLIVDPNANDPIVYADVPNFNISDDEEDDEERDEEDIRV